ncbi:hypothetical protein SLEP1_g20173 [Rubroshorea leprosula]|uniref:Uncharacterized protein n=1 Tax=Rubroshorea leprosula TaxID=152421 RepID=A0AAV5JDS4_9ROSI|nr:hypothetical protein SLEP1_g20173 [Rubroshorea leprosula]
MESSPSFSFHICVGSPLRTQILVLSPRIKPIFDSLSLDRLL